MNEDVELTLQDLVDFVRRGLLWALLLAAAAGAGMYTLTREVEPTYMARTTLIASHVDPSARAFGTVLLTAPPLDAAAYRTAILSRAVMAPASEILRDNGWDDFGNIAGAVTVSTEGTSNTTIIRLDARASDNRLAAAIANAVGEAAIVWDEARATRSLETIIQALTAQIDGIDTELAASLDANTREGLLRSRGDLSIQLSSARALRNAAVGRLEALEQALVPGAPIAPRPVQSGVAAALVAVVLVYALRFARQVLDVRIRSVESLTSLTGLPLLAEFRRRRGKGRRLEREATSYLRTNLLFDLADVHPKVVLVTSAAPKHGKSSVAISLAESFAAQGYKTLLLDADLRQPVMGSEYQLDPTRTTSLRAALLSDTVESATEIRFTRGASLHVYPSFVPSPNPTELLSNRMRPLLERVRGSYDVIVLDTAPLLPVADTLAIAPLVSSIVLVVSLRNANRRSVKSALDLLKRASPPLMGLVATDVTERSSAQHEGYGYGYGTAMTPPEEIVTAVRPGQSTDKTDPAMSRARR